MTKIKNLQNQFRVCDHVLFDQTEHGIVLIRIDHPLATATMSLEGGQVLEWQPKSQSLPVLWRAEAAHWLPDRAIRAGVPLCWPWFGPHPTESKAPSHGYARLCAWDVTAISMHPSGSIEIDLRMEATHGAATHHGLRASLASHISVGETLSISLITTNLSDHPIVITEALHAYFNIGDIRDIQIQGLNGCEYIDLLDQQRRKTQHGMIQFSEETGRVFLNTMNDCRLIDAKYNRTLRIQKTGSQSTVIWNPWLDTASKMNDLGPVEWQKMVCIESANAFDNTVRIEAGEQHTLSVSYSIED